MSDSLYETLGVDKSASSEDIKELIENLLESIILT